MDETRTVRVQDGATAGLPGPIEKVTADQMEFAKAMIWQAVLLQYGDSPPQALMPISDEFLLTDDPAEVEKFEAGNPHQCDTCKAASDVGVMLLKEPGNQMVLLLARLEFDEVWEC